MASKTLQKKRNRTLRINKVVTSLILPSQRVTPSDEKSKKGLRQERHTEIKQSSIFDSELGEVERETRGVPLTGSPCLRQKMLCEFSDLLLCCLLPALLRGANSHGQSLDPEKNPMWLEQGEQYRVKKKLLFFQNIACVPENGQLCSLWE